MQENESSAQKSNWGEWWFRFTAPHLPEKPTFAERELARRGRLASITVLFFSLFMLFPFF